MKTTAGLNELPQGWKQESNRKSSRKSDRNDHLAWWHVIMLLFLFFPAGFGAIYIKLDQEKDRRKKNGVILLLFGLAILFPALYQLFRVQTGNWDLREDYLKELIYPAGAAVLALAFTLWGGAVLRKGNRDIRLRKMVSENGMSDLKDLSVLLQLSLAGTCDKVEQMLRERLLVGWRPDYSAGCIYPANGRMPDAFFLTGNRDLFAERPWRHTWLKQPRFLLGICIAFSMISLFMLAFSGLVTIQKKPMDESSWQLFWSFARGLVPGTAAVCIHRLLLGKRIRYARCLYLLEDGKVSEEEIQEYCGFRKNQLEKAIKTFSKLGWQSRGDGNAALYRN